MLRLPHSSIEHQRRVPGRERSTKCRVHRPQRRIRVRSGRAGRPRRALAPTARSRRQWSPARPALLGLHGVLALHDSVLVVGLPAWVLATAVTPAVSPALFALNTLLVAATQVWVARWFARSGGPAGYTRTGLLLCAACLTFTLSTTVPQAALVAVLVCAVVLLTLGETGHTAAEAWLAVGLTEGRAAGTVLGLLKTTMSVQQALGPLLVVLLLTVGGRAGWVVLAALLLAAAILARRLAVGDLSVGQAVDPVEMR